MARPGYTASGRKIKKTYHYSVSKDRSKGATLKGTSTHSTSKSLSKQISQAPNFMNQPTIPTHKNQAYFGQQQSQAPQTPIQQPQSNSKYYTNPSAVYDESGKIIQQKNPSVLGAIFGQKGTPGIKEGVEFGIGGTGTGASLGFALSGAGPITKIGASKIPGLSLPQSFARIPYNKIIKPVSQIGKTIVSKTGTVAPVQTTVKQAGIIKKLLTKIITNKKTITVTNSAGEVSEQVITSTGWKAPLAVVGITIAAAGWVIEKSIGGQNFGKFIGVEESSQAAGIAVSTAMYAGDEENYYKARALQKDILSNESINEIGKMPYKNVADSLNNYARDVLAAGEIMDDVMANKFANGEANTTEFWAQYAEDKYTSERALIELQDMKIKAGEDRAVEARDEDAEFWREYREEAEKSAREETEWQGNYWLNYKKMALALEKEAQKAREESTPSSLNFGLL